MFECVEDGGVNSVGYLKIRKYFEDLDIVDAFDWFYKNNVGKDNPYHNNTHIFNVVELVKKYCDEVKIGKQMTQSYLVAALFHDFNHSGGKLEDSENIKIALCSVRKMMSEIGMTSLLSSNFMLPLYRLQVIGLIDLTKYPYNVKSNECFNVLRVIREADILSYEHTQWKKYVYEGLCKELGLNFDKKEENLTKLLDFHKNLVDKEIKLDFFKKFKKENYPLFEEEVKKEINNI